MELVEERRRSQVATRDLTYALYGSREIVEKLERLHPLILEDSTFDNQQVDLGSRVDKYRLGLRMAARLEQIAKENKLNEEDTTELRELLYSYTSCSSPVYLHIHFFIPNLSLLFTEQQRQKWDPLAKSFRIIGCYAQTELGHGSNVRALETTATYLPDSDEFDIHSPSLSAVKWWPGALAKTANCAIVYARLILNGRDHGVHNFMVQLRDLDTHECLPGVETGDIGPKIGFNNVDNGFCRFTHVRIPRDNMAMRIAMLSKDGVYKVNPQMPRSLLYFTMLENRMNFVRTSGMALAKACTISIRYSCVRKQGYDNTVKEKREVAVMDYQTQQRRLLPLLAASYAITLCGNQLDNFRQDLSTEVAQQNTTSLEFGHAVTCGLKVLTTDMACAGLEIARRACGGHGYLISSGIPVVLTDSLQLVTAEGENYMLSLQTARALLKVVSSYRDGKPLPEQMQFLRHLDKPIRTTKRYQSDWRNARHYVRSFQQRFLYQLKEAERRIGGVKDIATGIQKCSVDCYRLSMSYSSFMLVSQFANAVENAGTLSPEPIENEEETMRVMRLLCHLLALTMIEEHAGEFVESGALLPDEISDMRQVIEQLMLDIRPHAVRLVDAFNFSDKQLNTTLGKYDGRPYESLYESTKRNPMNLASEKIALTEFLKPLRDVETTSRL